MNLLTIVGYVGSLLVAVSLSMRNVRYLRRVNLIGAATFATYGLFIGAYPVFFLNAYITCIDIYYLWEMNKRKEYFSLLPVLEGNRAYLEKFLSYYQKDMAVFFPGINAERLAGCSMLFVLRNLLPVGLFAYRKLSPTAIEIIVDYAIPDYRDMKNGKFVYMAESNLLKERGYTEAFTHSDVPAHFKYLLKLGFTAVEGQPHTYRIEL